MNFIRRRTIKKRMLVTYALMAMLSIILCTLFVGYLITRFADEEYETYNNNTIRQMQSGIDEQMTRMYEMAENLKRDESLFSASLLSDGALLKVNNAMNRYNSSIKILKGYYIYYANERVKWILANGIIYNKRYYEQVNMPNCPSLADMRAYVETGEPLLLPLGGNPRYLVFACPLSFDPNSKREFVFLIDTQEIVDQARDAFGEQLAFLSLVTTGGDSLFEYGAPDGRAHVYSCPTRNQVSMRLKIGVRNTRSYSLLMTYSRIAAIYVLIVILATGAGVLYFSRLVYKPIYTTCNAILNNESRPEMAPFSELSELENHFSMMADEKNHLLGIVQRQASAMTMQLLNMLLYNLSLSRESNAQETGEKNLFQILDAQSGHRPMLLVYIVLDGLGGFMRLSPDERLDAQRQIGAELNRLSMVCDSVTLTGFNERCQLLGLLQPRAQVKRDDLLLSCRYMQNEIARRTGRSVTVALGRPFSSWEEISARSASVRALSQRRVAAGWNALFDELNPAEVKPYQPAAVDLAALHAACLAGDREAVCGQIRQCAAALYTCPDVGCLKCDMQTIRDALTHVSGLLLPEQGAFEAEREEDEPETAREAEDLLLREAETLLLRVTEEKYLRQMNVASKAVEYMEANYADALLNADSVAEALNISRAALQRCLKERYGSSPSAMLDEIRMRKARELLERSEMKVMEIVEAVGFVDVNNFIRKFKKQQGITPLQFRKSSRGMAEAGQEG